MTALDALNLAAPLSDTYNSVEQRLLVAIARQLSLNDTHKLNEVSKWQIKRLANLGMLRKDAARIIAAGTKGVPADFADTVQQAITSALAEDGLTDMWQNESFSESAKQSVKHYRAQAKDVYNQVNTVMKYKAESSFVSAVNSVADKWSAEMRRQQAEIADKQGFLDILNSNTADVVNGSAARTKAVRTTIHEMAQKGIPAFVDRAGREWSPEAYVNMDIRATVKNTALEAKFSVMDSLGQDVFEVSSHPGSRLKCRPWQGKLISRSGKTTEITDMHGRKHKVIPLSQTSFGEPDGLFGINCGHRPRGCSEGVFTKSAVEYDDEEDKALYNKVCRQRELERRVRKSKTEADMLEAAGDAEGAKEVRRRMSEQNKALRAYCEDNGLKFRSDRVKTYGAIAPSKITVPKPTSDNSQFYKPVEVDRSDQITAKRFVNGKQTEITLNRATERHNKIYLSEKAAIKPKALHEIDMRMTEVYKLLGCEKRKTLPNICVVSHDEMGGAPAAFNALHNALYLDEALLAIEEAPEFRAQMACSENRLSTALHECLHWLDADDYRRSHGNITADNYATKYLPYLREKCRKRLDKLQDNGYNISSISEYATRMYMNDCYDEVYTEYRVKELLKGVTS
ncbi:MAG: phage minor capsid protein [Oscillospiraceae bacterium]